MTPVLLICHYSFFFVKAALKDSFLSTQDSDICCRSKEIAKKNSFDFYTPVPSYEDLTVPVLARRWAWRWWTVPAASFLRDSRRTPAPPLLPPGRWGGSRPPSRQTWRPTAWSGRTAGAGTGGTGLPSRSTPRCPAREREKDIVRDVKINCLSVELRLEAC